MFKQLFLTEIDVSKRLLTTSFVINLIFFIPFGLDSDMSMGEFTSVTLVSFWVLVVICAVISGDEKRTRQYTQLPVTSTQIFVASWMMIIVWLGAQVSVWLMYGLLFESDFSAYIAAEAISTGLGALILISAFSIGFDLGAFRPAYVRWLYIGTIFALLLLIINMDISLDVENSIDGFVVFPVGLFFDGTMEMLLSAVLLMGLLVSNYLVFRFSDNYLG